MPLYFYERKTYYMKFKQLFVIFLILISICSFSLSEESERYDGTILFRNIPWGKDIDSVKNELNENGFNFYRDDEGIMGQNYSTVGSIVHHQGDYSLDFASEISSLSVSNCQVAGYDVKQTQIFFAYLPDENGLISKNRKDTYFTLASYQILPEDLDYAIDDLKEKLTSLYGDYDDFEHFNYGSMEFTYYIWMSKIDNSFVALNRIDYSLAPQLYIFYGTLDGTPIMAKAIQIQEEEAKKLEIENSKSGGTDGL